MDPYYYHYSSESDEEYVKLMKLKHPMRYRSSFKKEDDFDLAHEDDDYSDLRERLRRYYDNYRSDGKDESSGDVEKCVPKTPPTEVGFVGEVAPDTLEDERDTSNKRTRYFRPPSPTEYPPPPSSPTIGYDSNEPQAPDNWPESSTR